MKTKKLGKILGLAAVVILVLGFVFTISTSKPANNVIVDESIKTQVETVTLAVEGMAGESSFNLSAGDTVLDILKNMDSENSNLQLTVKDYAGMGVLVEGMNGKNNGTEDKYWQYEVNGLAPQIGADKLELSDGDAIRWHFSESEF